MSAIPMIQACARHQGESTALTYAEAVAIEEPEWVVLWDAFVPRAVNIGPRGEHDGPTKTWALVVK